ncbi:MAG: polysaccharide deacetylase family protein [Acidimicrobiales bacterium]
MGESDPAGGDADTSHARGPLRDLIGYRGQPPDPRWPGGAKLAINFVLNVEEGSEPSVLDGDGYTENRLTDATMPLDHNRDLAAEGLFEYGSRVGFWRVQRAFHEHEIPLTIFACAVALERNPPIAEAIIDGGHDVCSHGYRWVNHRAMGEEEEREQIRLAVASFRRTLGHQPPGWYCRYGPSINTRRLLVDHGGFAYDSDAYNDDLPYWTNVEGSNHLVLPYSLTTNDAKLLTSTGSEWSDFIGDAIDVLRHEGQERPTMLSIGLHPRIVGQPARFSGLARLLDRVGDLDDVWLTSRLAIADHWATAHPPPLT